MERLLLDTDILSEFFKGKDKIVTAHAAHYVAVHFELTFSIVSKYEVLRGLKRRSASVQLARFDRICRDSFILGVDDPIVEQASQLWADAVNDGKPARSSDLLIAATALEHNLTLCTGNTAHFDWIPGLRLVNWRLP